MQVITKRHALDIWERHRGPHVNAHGIPEWGRSLIEHLDRAGAFEPERVAVAPYGLAPADLAGLRPELVEARERFVARYCERMGWPTDPARLTSGQLFEIIDDEEWPK